MNLNNLNVSNSYETKRKRRSQYGDDIVKISDDEDSDFDLPGLRTHVYDFLELPDNYQKLEALKKLEEDGYIEREVNPENRRKYMLKTTSKGDEFVPKFRQISKDWEKEVGITEDDQELIERIKEIALNNMKLVEDL